MEGVFASYISRLSDEYIKVETMSPKVKETMLSDAIYITEKLSQLPGVRKMDRGLIQAVEAREVISTPPQQGDTVENGTNNSPASNDDVLFEAPQNEKEDEKEEQGTNRTENNV